MGDEDQGEVEFVDQVRDEVEDLGADGDVESAHWFVGDQDAGARGQGAGDGDALALAAGELVRVPVAGIRGQADSVQQLANALSRGWMPLYYKGFGDDVADAHPRIERAHRVLEDELQVLAEEAEAAFGQVG